MDITAHRKIREATHILAGTFGIGYFSPEKHGLSPEQRKQLDRITFELNDLVLNDPAPPECQFCATPLEQKPTGRPARYCSATCRSKDRTSP